MLYGCRCGVVEKYNYFMISAKMRLFWLLILTMKCSEVPFTHICEWKRHSAFSGSSSSYGWIVVVMIVVVDSASTIYFLLLFSESYFELGLNSFSLS